MKLQLNQALQIAIISPGYSHN